MDENGMNGYERLCYAIVNQAVSDYKALSYAGVIRDGRTIEAWPQWNGKNLKVSMFYDKLHKAVELVHWFKSETLNDILELVGSGIDQERILKELGIK